MVGLVQEEHGARAQDRARVVFAGWIAAQDLLPEFPAGKSAYPRWSPVARMRGSTHRALTAGIAGKTKAPARMPALPVCFT
jgi:hypothetical protein